MKIIVINGYAGVGKDTFIDCCMKISDSVFSISTIDPIKDIAYQIGWNGEKTPKSRKFLSDLKNLLTDYYDFSWNYIRNEVLDISNRYPDPIIFIHCREPKEIQRFKDEWGAKTLLIRRALAERTEQINQADNGVFNFEYDLMIGNNGSIEQLQRDAKHYIEMIERQEWESKVI